MLNRPDFHDEERTQPVSVFTIMPKLNHTNVFECKKVFKESHILLRMQLIVHNLISINYTKASFFICNICIIKKFKIKYVSSVHNII